MTKPLVLASGSQIRAKILKDAGFHFRVQKASDQAEPDEEENEKAPDYVLRAACAKGIDVSKTCLDEIILASDQVVEYKGNILRKVNSLDEAQTRLESLSGKSHHLIGGWCLYRNGECLDSGISKVEITLHKLESEEIRLYLEEEKPLSSVACYYIEGKGSKLIRQLKGDLFSALGLDLFEVNASLRKLNLRF